MENSKDNIKELQPGSFGEQLERHELKLLQHDKEIGRLSDQGLALQQNLNNAIIRMEENLKFQRAQVIDQNDNYKKLLDAILERNEKKEARAYNLKKTSQANMFKLVIAISGGTGLIVTILQLLLKAWGE